MFSNKFSYLLPRYPPKKGKRTMIYRVTIKYLDFDFTDGANALNFAALAKSTATEDYTVSIEFINKEEE